MERFQKLRQKNAKRTDWYIVGNSQDCYFYILANHAQRFHEQGGNIVLGLCIGEGRSCQNPVILSNIKVRNFVQLPYYSYKLRCPVLLLMDMLLYIYNLYCRENVFLFFLYNQMFLSQKRYAHLPPPFSEVAIFT